MTPAPERGIEAIEPFGWMTLREEREAHAAMWASVKGDGYGTVCGYKSGARGWSAAEDRAPKCRECRSILARADREKQQAESE